MSMILVFYIVTFLYLIVKSMFAYTVFCYARNEFYEIP